MSKIILLGSKGQLGKEISKVLKKKNIKFTSYDKKLKRNNIDFLKVNSFFLKIEKKLPSIIINCIAMTNVDLCEIKKKNCKMINYINLKKLALFCKRHNIWLINFSSDYVFDGLKKDKYKEEDIASPLNYYGFCKLKSDNFIKKNLKKFIIFRTSWIYSNNTENNFVKKIINKFKKNQIIHISEDNIGVPNSANFIAKSVIKICLILKENEKLSGIYNLTCSGHVSRYNFTIKIFDLINKKKLGINFTKKILKDDLYKTLANRPKRVILNNKKILRVLKIPNVHWVNEFKNFIKANDL